MGDLRRASKRRAISRAEEIRTLALVLVACLVPAVGVTIGIVATTQPDLSYLVPIRRAETDPDLLSWSSLLRDDDGNTGVPPDLRTGIVVRALGYMADGDRVPREGEWVREFRLLPDTGNLLRLPHSHTDQMIAVHLDDGIRIRYSSKALVWVWGSLQALQEDARDARPLYTLERAHAQPAEKAEIRKYFQ